MFERDELGRRDVLKAMALASTGLVMGTAGAQSTTRASGANGKAGIVTGSSRGIGAATAKRLAQDGYAMVAPPGTRIDFQGNAQIFAYLSGANRRKHVGM